MSSKIAPANKLLKQMSNHQMLNGIIRLCDMVYSTTKPNGEFNFKLVHKETKEEIPIINPIDLANHLNKIFLETRGIFDIDDGVLSWTEEAEEEKTVLAYYSELDKRWVAF